MKVTRPTLLSLLLLTLLVALSASPILAQDELATLKQEAAATYADIVFASYQDAYTTALDLQTAIDSFLDAPSDDTLQAARAAWLAAREPYGQTEAFRFYGGPIDDADGPEGLINAWPLDEVYIDYVDGDPDSGIIQDTTDYPDLDAELLESLNESGAEENISVGYHAVEFLLWGQDLSADGPGARPFTDYTTAPNAERRAAYLRLVTDRLVEHLDYLVSEWDPTAEDNYRATFLALPPDDAISAILTGIGVLSKSELAGERMFTAYDNRDQEDEHSCFSDNTHRDIVNNFNGIRNVYSGHYTRVDGSVVEGTSLASVIEAVDPDLNATVLETLTNADTLVNSIPAPFDQAIVSDDSRPIILAAVFSLMDLGDLFAESASELGLTINTALPE
ncbi:MAG: iron-regulated protein [Anaerolineae bacterium]|nr:iron-regulated protein [Anaerolineae bacterium]